jgi:hypothetical protein
MDNNNDSLENNQDPLASDRLDTSQLEDEKKLEDGDTLKTTGTAKSESVSKKPSATNKISVNTSSATQNSNRLKDKYQEEGTLGAAKETARIAAEQIASKYAGVVGKKAATWATKKGNPQKLGLILLGILSIPVLIIFLLLYAGNNKGEFLSQVVSSPKSVEFASEAAKLVGKNIISGEDTYKKFGYSDLKDGTAYAQSTNTLKPEPGSIEEKILKINYQKAKYQTRPTPDCAYKFTYKPLIGPDGKTTSIIDKVYDRNGREVETRSDLFGYCVVQSMPLYNLSFRTKQAREVNKFNGVVQSFSLNKDKPGEKQSLKDVEEEVYDKTLKRITSKPDSTPSVSGYESISSEPEKGGIETYITKVRNALDNQEDPNEIVFPFTKNPDNPEVIGKTMCAFSEGYLTQDNIKKAITSRLGTAQRSGNKNTTVAISRLIKQLNNQQVSALTGQSDGWTSSTAYSQNVYGRTTGQKIDPESIANSAYGADYTDVISLLFELKNKCKDLKSSSSFFGGLLAFLGGDNEEEAQQKVVNIYRSLQDIIIRDSNGKFTNIGSFGMEQLIIGVIRMGGGSAVSGLEEGPQNFNNQDQGFRSLRNSYAMQYGGGFLTKEQSNKRALESENFRIQTEKASGIAYRLFSPDNVRSLANIMKYETPNTGSELKIKTEKYIATLLNPLKLIDDAQNTIGYILKGERNTAYAASEIGDAYMKLDTVGISDELFDRYNAIDVSNEIQKTLKDGSEQDKFILGIFEKCSKSNIPTANYFIRGYQVNNNGVLEKSKPFTVEEEGVDLPKYPSVGEDESSAAPNFKELGFENRKEMIACEIYLLSERAETKRDLGPEVQKKVFGKDISGLAEKYKVYLYANSIVDMMVELSNDEYNDSIYSKSQGKTTEGQVLADADENAPCPSGTQLQQVGIDKDRTGAEVKRFNVCVIDGTTINVNVKIAANTKALIEKAKAEGLNLNGTSFRSYDKQVELRKAHCGTSNFDIYEKPSGQCSPPTAIPGNSNHETGLAIDFSNCSSRSTACYNWLASNAAAFGLKNLPSEPWHWSVDGG